MVTVYVDPVRVRENPLAKHDERHFYESIEMAVSMLRRGGVKGKIRIIATEQAIEEYQGNA